MAIVSYVDKLMVRATSARGRKKRVLKEQFRFRENESFKGKVEELGLNASAEHT